MLRLDLRVVRRRVLATTAVVAALGLVAELVNALGPARDAAFVGFFSLSYEGNLPTWYSALLLAACATALHAVGAMTAQAGGPKHRHWLGLAAAFAYISLDEVVSLHERLNGLVGTRGLLYFDWIIPAAAVLVVLAALYVPFLLHLPPATRRRFVLAGCLYVGGALVMELPLGWWTERAGDDNLVYALIDFVEESLEMTGASLFLLAVLDHAARGASHLRLVAGREP